MTRRTATAAKAEQPDLLGPTPPLTEGMTRKGGRNKAPSQITKRPAAPAPISKKKTGAQATTAVAVIRRDQDSLLAIAARAAENPNIDAAKMREIFEMQKEVRADQARAYFNECFLAMQDELPEIRADGKIEILEKGSDGKRVAGRDRVQQATPYATYKNILKTVKPILQRNGFSIWQSTEPMPDGRLVVKTALEHIGGHRRETAFPLPAETSGSKNNVQGWGSAQSYGRRYGVVALLNLITGDPGDDDANGVKVVDAKAVEVVDDGPAAISVEQHDKLVEAIEASGATRKQFCNAYKIDKVADLPAENFDRAMKACADRSKR